MSDLCDHIIAHCADLNLCKDTLILKALILMGGGQYKEALQILEADSDPRTLSRESDSVLVSAYLMNGDREKACDFAQITMYLNLFSLVELSAKYLTVAASDQNAFDMTVERVESLIDSYQLVKLNANAVSVLSTRQRLDICSLTIPMPLLPIPGNTWTESARFCQTKSIAFMVTATLTGLITGSNSLQTALSLPGREKHS